MINASHRACGGLRRILRLDAHGGLLQSVSGYVWPLACDHVDIVHCAGSHMNLMTSESNGGDLDETIVPHMRQQLASEWNDLGNHANARVRADVPWIQSIWHPELGLSMSASPSLIFGSRGRQTDATDDDDDDDDDACRSRGDLSVGTL